MAALGVWDRLAPRLQALPSPFHSASARQRQEIYSARALACNYRSRLLALTIVPVSTFGGRRRPATSVIRGEVATWPLAAMNDCFQVPFRPTNGRTGREVQVTLVTDTVDDSEPIDVIAKVSFLTLSEGGRSGPIRGHYRPNHNFGSAEDQLTYIGQLEFAPGDHVAPGESRKVLIRFVSEPGLDSLLSEGREWRIQEGSTLVARGRVIARCSKVTEGRR